MKFQRWVYAGSAAAHKALRLIKRCGLKNKKLRFINNWKSRLRIPPKSAT